MSRPIGSKNKPKTNINETPNDTTDTTNLNTEINSSNNQDSQEQTTSNSVELNSFSDTFFYEALIDGMVTTEQLKLWMKYPMKFNKQIRYLSRQMYNYNGQYSKAVDTYTNIASLDLLTTCYESTKANQKKRKLFKQLLERINHKAITRNIIKTLLIDGMYVGILRSTDEANKNVQLQSGIEMILDRIEGLALEDGVMIQPLDNDYVKIIGFGKNNELVAAFDMMYFNQFKGNGLIGEIKNYPKEFIQAYIDYQKDGGRRWFRLSIDNTIVLKYKSTTIEAYGRPLCLCAMTDILFADQYTDSQRANIAETASNIVYLIQPEGEKKGTCSLTKEQQTNQYNNFKKAVYSNSTNTNSGGRMAKTTTIVLAPGTQVDKLKKDASLLKDTLTNENMRKVATGVGMSASLLNGEGENVNYSSLQMNISLILCEVFAIIDDIAHEFTKIFNIYMFSGKTEIINVSYLHTSLMNRDETFGYAKDLFTFGGSIDYLIASAGFDIDTYKETLRYEREQGYYNYDDDNALFIPHMSTYTANNDTMGGRPEDKKSTNDNTIASKTAGANEMIRPGKK